MWLKPWAGISLAILTRVTQNPHLSEWIMDTWLLGIQDRSLCWLHAKRKQGEVTPPPQLLCQFRHWDGPTWLGRQSMCLHIPYFGDSLMGSFSRPNSAACPPCWRGSQHQVARKPCNGQCPCGSWSLIPADRVGCGVPQVEGRSPDAGCCTSAPAAPMHMLHQYSHRVLLWSFISPNTW